MLEAERHRLILKLAGERWGKKRFTGCYGLNRLSLMEVDPLVVQAQLKRGTGAIAGCWRSGDPGRQ